MRTTIVRYIDNQRGLTLVEMLASITIFVLIFIPLSSVYIRGVELYNQTQEQTSLRNEADFVIGDVMRTVQEATYFEMGDVSNATEFATLLEIFRSAKAGKLIDVDTKEPDSLFTDSLVLYNRSSVYEPVDPSKPVDSNTNPNVTKWLLTRKNYLFQLPASPTAIDQVFAHSPNYLVRGLFRISPDNKSLMLYLVIAPFGAAAFDQEGQQMRFASLQEIRDELNRQATSDPDRVSSYIRFVKTDFAVNNLRRGE